jgi:biotin carboxyl carrier protein
VIALDRQIAVEERRVAFLRADRTPTPTFSLSALFNNPGEFTAGAGAGVSVELPLFSRNQGQIAESLATTAQLRARRDATLRTIENSIAGIVARIDAERRQLEAFERRLVPTATDLQALAEESYRAGRTSVLGLLDSQRSLRELRRDALQAALDLQTVDCGAGGDSWYCSSLRTRHAELAELAERSFSYARSALSAWIVVSAIGCGGKATEDAETEPAEVPTIVAESAPVTRKTLVDELVVRGPITAVPNEDVKVSALVPGRVNTVTIAEGDSVRQGQVIAELDRQPLEDQRRQAAAAVRPGQGTGRERPARDAAQPAALRTRHRRRQGSRGREERCVHRAGGARQRRTPRSARPRATSSVPPSDRRSAARWSNAWSASANRWTAPPHSRSRKSPTSIASSWRPTFRPITCRG